MATAPATIRVNGLREVNRAFARIDKDVAKDVKATLAKVADPVASDAAQRISRYAGASTSTITPIGTMKGVLVRQRQRKRSGLRTDFGALQMRHLLGALYDHEDEVYERVEATLDWLARREGF